MKKTVIGLCLLAVGVWGIMIIQPQADGAYYRSEPGIGLEVITDTGTATTTDSGVIATPIPAYRFTGYTAKIRFGTPFNALHGWANSDTVVIRLRTSLGDGQVKTLDSARLSPPCSLFTELPIAKLGLDSAIARSKSLYKDLFWTWKVTDTTSDTLFTVGQPFYWEVIVRE